MENFKQNVTEQTGSESPWKDNEKFFPSGAIAFFILLVLLCIAFWYFIYFLMIQRT